MSNTFIQEMPSHTSQPQPIARWLHWSSYLDLQEKIAKISSWNVYIRNLEENVIARLSLDIVLTTHPKPLASYI